MAQGELEPEEANQSPAAKHVPLGGRGINQNQATIAELNLRFPLPIVAWQTNDVSLKRKRNGGYRRRDELSGFMLLGSRAL
jgi:hypothetical protein